MSRTNLPIGCVVSVYSRSLESQVALKDDRSFYQVIASEGCTIEVRKYREIPFAPKERETVIVNAKRWDFRDGPDIRVKSRAATA